METEIEFETMSNVADERFKSLVMLARKGSQELFNIACLDGDWVVGLATQQGYVKVSWEDFVDIFHQFAVFMATENKSMLAECEQDKPMGE